MTTDPHEFTRDAWEANAEVWDARMGDEGNDFFNIKYRPPLCVRRAQSQPSDARFAGR